MPRHFAVLAVGIVSIGVLVGSCKKDEGGTTAPIQTGPLLTAVPSGVSVGTNVSQNVTITGGTHPYTAASQNPGLATAQFVNANVDTAVLVITGVSTATGPTSVVARDASTPQKSVSVSVTKTQ